MYKDPSGFLSQVSLYAAELDAYTEASAQHLLFDASKEWVVLNALDLSGFSM